MTTEYRRGIPPRPLIEAATRLGLLWRRRGRDAEHRTRFIVENTQVLSDYGEEGDPLLARPFSRANTALLLNNPGCTPVDWRLS